MTSHYMLALVSALSQHDQLTQAKNKTNKKKKVPVPLVSDTAERELRVDGTTSAFDSFSYFKW